MSSAEDFTHNAPCKSTPALEADELWADLVTVMRSESRRPAGQPARAVIHMALAINGPMDALSMAHMLDMEASHVARCCQWLVQQGLATEEPGGLYARAGVTPACARSLSVGERDVSDHYVVPHVSVGLGFFPSRAQLTSAADLTALRWQPTPTVAASPWLEPAVRLCHLLAEQLEERGHPGVAAAATSRAWVVPMELLLRKDLEPQGQPRLPDERVAATLRWLHEGRDEVAAFWQQNILSPGKLRKQWGRMASQLAALRRRGQGGKLVATGVVTPGAQQQIADLAAATLARKGLPS